MLKHTHIAMVSAWLRAKWTIEANLRFARKNEIVWGRQQGLRTLGRKNGVVLVHKVGCVASSVVVRGGCILQRVDVKPSGCAPPQLTYRARMRLRNIGFDDHTASK